jgi:hypothetical protein
LDNGGRRGHLTSGRRAVVQAGARIAKLGEHVKALYRRRSTTLRSALSSLAWESQASVCCRDSAGSWRLRHSLLSILRCSRKARVLSRAVPSSLLLLVLGPAEQFHARGARLLPAVRDRADEGTARCRASTAGVWWSSVICSRRVQHDETRARGLDTGSN